MLHTFGHSVATCCDMLRVKNRTSAQAWAQHCCRTWPNDYNIKPRSNDRNSSTKHIATLLAQYLQALAKLLQHLDATYPNIVGRNMLRAFSHHIVRCCDMLRVENRTSAHVLTQYCCTNLARRLQHHATSTNVAWKICPVSNLSQQ